MKTTTLACAMILGLSLGPFSGAQAQIIGKPGAVVQVERTDSIALAPDSHARIALNFKGPAHTPLTVRYTTDPGLQLESTGQTVLHTDQDGLATDSPALHALSEGVHYLHVFIHQNDQQQTTSVRVEVGQGQAAAKRHKNTRQVTTPDGQNLIILPAE
ncbi:hypothetical protein ACMHYJ_00615 [Castellaniella hirudinis]|uniref:hypothetical protein n=1 Tax=Castellaniella hirudinis TaxID=1144617 RepID=UPI0039C27DA2